MKKKEAIFERQSTSRMRLYMIIFIACLSYSKSIVLPNATKQFLNISKLPVVGKFFQSAAGTTTISVPPDNSTQTESPLSTQSDSPQVNMVELNEKINTTIGNDLLQIISQQSNESNEAVEKTVNSISNLEYWEPVTSKLENVWDRIKQVFRYAAKTLRKATSYIEQKLQQFKVYINQGSEIIKILYNAVKSAGEVTKDSDDPTIKNINNFVVQSKDILKNFKDLFKPNPIELASDRDRLAE